MITDLLSGKRGFASDTCSGAHPAVMEAILQANAGHAPSYGADALTAACERAFCDTFGRKVYPFLVLNGTGANCALLAHITPRYGGIVCTDCAHINTHETAAPERMINSKLLQKPSAPLRVDGKLASGEVRLAKLTPEHIEQAAEALGDDHSAQPLVVSITQATELGTLYTPGEIFELSSAAHRHGMVVAMDGARIANAAAALNLPVSAFTCDAGVDALVFGGTKNGMLFGEAIVFFDEGLARGFQYTRKGTGQLASKMRFVAAQFLALLKDGLWLELASHANSMARALADGLALAGVDLIMPEANLVFADLSDALAASLLLEVEVHRMMGLWRFVASFDTCVDEVERVIEIARGGVGI